jgi:hemerythrin
VSKTTRSSDAFFDWRPGYDLNIETMDDQHHSIVEAVNRTHEELRAPVNAFTATTATTPSTSALPQSLKDLEAAISNHFSAEEKFMSTIGFPRFKEHQLRHAELNEAVSALFQKDLPPRNQIRPLLIFIKGWFLDHSQNADREYVTYLKSKKNP